MKSTRDIQPTLVMIVDRRERETSAIPTNDHRLHRKITIMQLHLFFALDLTWILEWHVTLIGDEVLR